MFARTGPLGGETDRTPPPWQVRYGRRYSNWEEKEEEGFFIVVDLKLGYPVMVNETLWTRVHTGAAKHDFFRK